MKRKNNEIVEKATKKIELKEIESFSNDSMQLISISKKIVQLIILNQKENVTTSRKRTIKFDKIFYITTNQSKNIETTSKI